MEQSSLSEVFPELEVAEGLFLDLFIFPCMLALGFVCMIRITNDDILGINS